MIKKVSLKRFAYCAVFMAISNPILAGGRYDPSSAVVYAQKYTSNKETLRNPEYRNFSSDCTNFISQILRVAGLTDTKTETRAVYGGRDGKQLLRYEVDPNHVVNWYHMNSTSFFNRNPSPTSFSDTWSLADSSARRLMSGYDGWKYDRFYTLAKTQNIMVELGDIVYANWDSSADARIDHSMIVTGFMKVGAGYEPRLTYHSTDTLNLSFSAFRKKLSERPNAQIYVVRRALRSSVPPSWAVF